jgi:hypothetical protein
MGVGWCEWGWGNEGGGMGVGGVGGCTQAIFTANIHNTVPYMLLCIVYIYSVANKVCKCFTFIY